jgi:hypothetical protein
MDLALRGCVQLDPNTFQLTVRERSSERRWFRTVTNEIEKTYSLDVRVGRFMDGDRLVMDNALSFRLWEIFMAWRAEQKLDAYVGLPHG